MYLSLFQIIALMKGVATKNEARHIIMKNDGLHFLLKNCARQGLMNKGALQGIFLSRIHTGHPTLPPQVSSLDLSVLWLLLRMITTYIISQRILLMSLDMFLLL
jgi:hypothetical protein